MAQRTTDEQSQLLVMRPRSVTEASPCIVQVREGNTVILCLGDGGISLGVAQRIVDYIAGGVFALDGKTARAGEDVFVFAPILGQGFNPLAL